jgi:hypothetical protein
MSWVAEHTKAVGAVLQEAKFEKSKHITGEAHNKIVDRIFQVLQEDWTLHTDLNASAWLKGALLALTPRLCALYRQKLGRLKDENEDEVDKDNLDSRSTGKKPSIAKSTTTTRSTAARSTAATSVSSNLSPTKESVKKRGAWRTTVVSQPQQEDSERRHKLEGVDHNVYLRALDRSIVVQIDKQEFPFVVGMHALLQEQHLDRGLDNLTHIHLCWHTFQKLLQSVEEGFDSDYAADSMEVRWIDPSSKEVRIITGQSTFVRAVGILGSVAEDKAYIKMTLS